MYGVQTKPSLVHSRSASYYYVFGWNCVLFWVAGGYTDTTVCLNASICTGLILVLLAGYCSLSVGTSVSGAPIRFDGTICYWCWLLVVDIIYIYMYGYIRFGYMERRRPSKTVPSTTAIRCRSLCLHTETGEMRNAKRTKWRARHRQHSLVGPRGGGAAPAHRRWIGW